MSEHGTRKAYRDGCRCTPCRAAEAGYRAGLRRRRAQQLPVLGARLSAVETWRRIRLLKREGFSKAELARRVFRRDKLRIDRDVVTVRTAIRVYQFYRQQTAIGLEESAA